MLGYKDATVVQCVLESLSNILKHAGTIPGDDTSKEEITSQIEECGGLDKIEVLQTHESNEVYTLAYKIIEEYFGDGVSAQTISNVIRDKQRILSIFFVPGSEHRRPLSVPGLNGNSQRWLQILMSDVALTQV